MANPTSPSLQQKQPPPLRLAEILSDLVSLRVCHPSAALALVSARPTTSSNTPNVTTSSSSPPAAAAEKQGDAAQMDRNTDGYVDGGAGDVDLQRAKDIVQLHYAVKEAHRRGELERGLVEARERVGRVV